MPTPDLHCHSTISDGLLTPAEVVARAAGNGVDLLALTDHDDLGGLAEAGQAAAARGIRFINGVEISVAWEDSSVHIVGLGMDPHHEPLRAGLAQLRQGRLGRAERMAAELARIGIHGALEGALRHAGNPEMVGRAHFARFLVEQGLARDVKNVFDHYLATGKPGFVPHQWASLDQAVGWIRGAGGVAVIAHPARYRLGSNARSRLYHAFKALDGCAIEVVSGVHSQEEIHALASVARHHGFEASSGSDFHGPTESLTDLGRLPPLPPDLTPVWRRWLTS